MVDDQRQANEPIVFARRLAGSEAFREMFREGMALVEETADYLDGDGREESQGLDRVGSLAYATESMRLTTRLMQLASWLLLQRAVGEGEMTVEQAKVEKSKVKLSGPSTATDGAGWDGLPETLRQLILRSLRLQARIRRLEVVHPPNSGGHNNPVARQIGAIERAFDVVAK